MNDILDQIQKTLNATGVARESSTHLTRCCGILNQHPRHAEYVVGRLPGLEALDQDERAMIWRALSSPSAGVPSQGSERMEYLAGVRKFLAALEAAESSTWVNKLALMMMEAGTLSQYGVAMEAMPGDDLRRRLVERLMTRMVGNAVTDPSAHMPAWWALHEQLRHEWAEDAETRDAWRWAWLRGCLRHEEPIEDSVIAMDQILSSLEGLGISIHEAGGDGLDLLKSHLDHNTLNSNPSSCAVVRLLLDRGADFTEVIQWDLMPATRKTLADHPAVRRARLVELVSQEEPASTPGPAKRKI